MRRDLNEAVLRRQAQDSVGTLAAIVGAVGRSARESVAVSAFVPLLGIDLVVRGALTLRALGERLGSIHQPIDDNDVDPLDPRDRAYSQPAGITIPRSRS